MKNNLIRAKDNKDIFYDVVEKKYRYRMYCPDCGKVSGCRCFDTRREVEIFIDDNIDFSCSNICVLKSYDEQLEYSDVKSIMEEKGLKWRLKWYIYYYFKYISENDASIIVDCLDFDYDFAQGESC